jgi:hypothetical protein
VQYLRTVEEEAMQQGSLKVPEGAIVLQSEASGKQFTSFRNNS